MKCWFFLLHFFHRNRFLCHPVKVLNQLTAAYESWREEESLRTTSLRSLNHVPWTWRWGHGVRVYQNHGVFISTLEQVSKTWAKNTGFWKDFWYLQCFCQRCMQSTRVYSSIFFNPRQNRQFFHCHRARLKMWYHVFYCAWIRRVPPQLKLTLCLWKDTLLHWCGWGLAISAGLATKSLATGAGGHCGQGLFALSSGPWWTDSDSIIIMLDVIDSWIVPLRQPIISTPKDSSERKPEHKNRHQVPPPERLCFQNLRDFLERGFSGGIRSDSRRYLLGNM